MLRKIHNDPNPHSELPCIDPGIVDTKRLQMFYVSVKEGSFAAAAQVLSLSPSAISHAMKSLEEDLGCSLFRRSGPQVNPTGAAIRLMPMVEEMLAHMASIRRELAMADGRLERLVFRLPQSLMGLLRTGVLSTFHECFPAAELEIISHSGDGSVPPEGYLDFEIDYAHLVPKEVVQRDLVIEEYHPYVAPFHQLGQTSRVSIADLKGSLLIIPDSYVVSVLTRYLEPGAVGGLRKWMVPDSRAAHELAKQGQGIVFLTELAARTALVDGSLVRLKAQGLEIKRRCCAWWEPKRPLSWMAEVFLSLIAAKTDES